MLQLKLFKIFNKQKKETLDKLHELFGDKNIFIFSDNIVGISYDYEERGYKYVLEKVMELDIQQFIITSNIFMNLISFYVTKKIHIKNIMFVDSIEQEERDFVNSYIEKINSEENVEQRQSLKETLFDELKWITSDECIDIKAIESVVWIANPPVFVSIELVHNGVLLVGNSVILNDLKEIIDSITRR